MTLQVPSVSQQDIRWALLLLGNGTGTIKDYGCLLCAYCAVLNYYGFSYTPALLNDALKAIGAFFGNSKNLLELSIAIKLLDGLKYTEKVNTYTDADDKHVKALLSQGIPVILRVDPIKNSKREDHFVVALGDKKIMDTFDGKIKPASTYEITGYRVITYEKKEQNMPNTGIPQELQQYGKGSLTDLVSYIDQLRKDRSDFDSFLSHLGVKTLEEATKLYDSKSATSEAQFKIITDKLDTIKNTQDVAFSQLDTDRQNLDKIVITTASINDKQDTLTDNLTDFRKNVKEVVSTSTEDGNKPLLDKVEEIKKTLDTFVTSKKVTLNVTETVGLIERIKGLFK